MISSRNAFAVGLEGTILAMHPVLSHHDHLASGHGFKGGGRSAPASKSVQIRCRVVHASVEVLADADGTDRISGIRLRNSDC